MESLSSQELERLQDRFVFDGGGDDVATIDFLGVLAESKNHEVVTLRRAAGEDYVLALAFNDSRDLVASSLNGLLGAHAVFVGATASVAEFLADEMQEFSFDLRINRRRGVAIEVNRRHGLF